MASGPLILIMAIDELTGGVDGAKIVSSVIGPVTVSA